MAKGKLLYRKKVEIKGYNGFFEKECRLDIKDGFFSINYPKMMVAENIVKIEYCCSDTLEDVEKKWRNAIADFEMMHFDFKMVIMYQVEEVGSYQDGSGTGFVFNWGVYKKIDSKNEDNRFWNGYHYVRGFGKDNSYSISANSGEDWKEIEWTEQSENFFNELSKQIESIYARLSYFVTKVDFSEIENKKLLD